MRCCATRCARRATSGCRSPRAASASRPDAPIEDISENPYILPDARRSEDVLLTRFDAAALVPVLQGRQLLLVHVERASDILQTLALKREFRAAAAGAGRRRRGLARRRPIAAADVPVIANALNDLPASFEQLAATQSNVGRMRAAGSRSRSA